MCDAWPQLRGKDGIERVICDVDEKWVGIAPKGITEGQQTLDIPGF